MTTLADAIRENETEVRRVLQVGYAVWDDLLERIERQEATSKADFYDEQIWTFLVACSYSVVPGGPTQLLHNSSEMPLSLRKPSGLRFSHIPHG
jgi:hypothetical protein